MKLKLEEGTFHVLMIQGVNDLVLGDHMLFPRRLSVRMSRCGFRSEDILLEELVLQAPLGTFGA